VLSVHNAFLSLQFCVVNNGFVMCRIDRDGSLSLDWNEWRNFFQFYPSGDLEDIVKYWRQSLVFLPCYFSSYDVMKFVQFYIYTE